MSTDVINEIISTYVSRKHQDIRQEFMFMLCKMKKKQMRM